MKKLILILFIGFLLPIQEVKAQRIEYDSLGIPHACTNYAIHNQERQNQRIVQGLLFIGACVTILAIEHSMYPSQQNSVEHLGHQMGYAGIAVIGACITVSLYRWQVKAQDKIGL